MPREPLYPHVPKSKKKAELKLTRDDVVVNAWQERDRIGIWVDNKWTGKTIAEWWDDNAREMFEDGFFKGAVPVYSWEKPSTEFVNSVLDYLEYTRVLAT